MYSIIFMTGTVYAFLFILLQIPKHISINYKMKMKPVLPVKNLKPAVVKVYDYYQTSKILF